MKLIKLLGFAALSTLLACSVASSDDAAADDGAEVDQSADELTSGVSTYFTIRHDFRRCVSPICGGYWVKRVNTATTRCVGGTYEAECYVADLNLAPLGLSDAALADVNSAPGLVLRGSITTKTYANFGKLGSFRATEAWRASADGAATGTFYLVDDSGIRCFRAPCPSERERKLNSSAAAKNVADVDLAAAPGTATQKSDAIGEIAAHGLIVAGTNSGPSTGVTLHGTQYFTRVRGELAAGAACSSGDTCGGGTKCCYPCGIQGCQNRCITPMASGQCPMFP